jgi:Fungal trichothecene efflux pump (TRI12)
MSAMRRTNWRFVIVGLVLVIAACAFFLGGASFMGRSNDPETMMQTVGAVSGVAGALGVVLAVLGVWGKRF